MDTLFNNFAQGGSFMGFLIRSCNLMIIILLLIFFLSFGFYQITDASTLTYEENIDRPGNDYKSFELTYPDHRLCLTACNDDTRCRAYTYVKPGIQGSNAKCWLKNEIPKATSNHCCISGVKVAVQEGGRTSSSPQETSQEKPLFKLPSKPLKMPTQQPEAMPEPLPAPQTFQKLHVEEHVVNQSVSDFRHNIDLPGKDYKSFDLSHPDPDLCRQACINDPKCQAFTYVKPGIQGPNARCWLKSEVPPAKNSACCISGIVQREFLRAPTSPDPKGAMAQDNVDLPGMDYKNFDLNVPDPRLCQNACLDDPKCKAFTYVKPGFQGPNARCWLKDGVPQTKPNSCCISGIKEKISQSKINVQQEPRADKFAISPENALRLQKLRHLDATWQKELQSRINEVDARMQMTINDMRRRNSMIFQKNLATLDIAKAEKKKVELCMTPDGRLEPCPEDYHIGKPDPSPKIEMYFASTNGLNRNIVAGDNVLIHGYNFGDEIGFLKFETIQQKGVYTKPVNISFDILLWTDSLIHISIHDKINDLFRPTPMLLEVRNRQHSALADFKSLSIGPKIVITRISGMRYLKRDDDGEKASSAETLGVLKVSHDPECGRFDWSGNSGDDWFFKQYPLPEYVTLIDYIIQVVDPDIPKSSLESFFGGLKSVRELAEDLLTADFSKIGAFVTGSFCGWFDDSVGEYSAKITKEPRLPDDPSMKIHWENTCMLMSYYGLPIEYLASFIVAYPEGFPAP